MLLLFIRSFTNTHACMRAVQIQHFNQQYDPSTAGWPAEARPDQAIKLPGHIRVGNDEYREFLALGHGDIFDLDMDRCVAWRERQGVCSVVCGGLARKAGGRPAAQHMALCGRCQGGRGGTSCSSVMVVLGRRVRGCKTTLHHSMPSLAQPGRAARTGERSVLQRCERRELRRLHLQAHNARVRPTCMP